MPLQAERGYHRSANKRPPRVYLAVGWVAKESTHVQDYAILYEVTQHTLHTVLTTKEIMRLMCYIY